MAGIKSDGSPGSLILFTRTELTESLLNSTSLEYGEPLYNETEKTLTIGDKSGTAPAQLSVFKAIARTLKDKFIFFNLSATNTNNKFVDIKDENNTSLYVKNKVWGTYTINPNTSTWFNVGSNGKITGNATSNPTFPAFYKLTVANMTSDLVPQIELYPNTTAIRTASEMKLWKKRFSLICPGSYSDSNCIYLLFSKKPDNTFDIRITEG